MYVPEHLFTYIGGPHWGHRTLSQGPPERLNMASGAALRKYPSTSL